MKVIAEGVGCLRDDIFKLLADVLQASRVDRNLSQLRKGECGRPDYVGHSSAQRFRQQVVGALSDSFVQLGLAQVQILDVPYGRLDEPHDLFVNARYHRRKGQRPREGGLFKDSITVREGADHCRVLIVIVCLDARIVVGEECSSELCCTLHPKRRCVALFGADAHIVQAGARVAVVLEGLAKVDDELLHFQDGIGIVEGAQLGLEGLGNFGDSRVPQIIHPLFRQELVRCTQDGVFDNEEASDLIKALTVSLRHLTTNRHERL
mmetsp:Transcript_3758/g.9449  ORF Transcript_3758/g.9449 Transcript_3758/m.9449 type:complete len:264 (-) Transcript_3758:1176-1967(-)